jgi:hypothetical protein
MAERENPLALARQATEEQARARLLHEEAARFAEASRRLRTRAGNPSVRDMARACDGRPAAPTVCRMLASGDRPARFEVIDGVGS